MKKYCIALITLLLAGSLIVSGCGGSTTKAPEQKAADTTAEAPKGDGSWDKVKEKGEFILGLDESFPPMGFRDAKGEITGFDVDLAKEVFTRLGVKLTLQPINWDAKEQELNTGNIDCIWNGFTITDERKKAMLFSNPYMKNRQIIVVMDKSPIKTKEDLAGKKLALQAGSSAADALNANADFKAKLNGGKAIEFDDNMTALLDLEKGGVDAVLMDEIVARYYIASKSKAYRVLDQELASEEYGIGFRKDDQELMNKVQATLDAMASDGKLAEISTKWFSKDISTVGK